MGKEGRSTAEDVRSEREGRSFPWKAVLWAILVLGGCAAVAIAAYSVRACSRDLEVGFRTESIQRIYEYGASLSQDSRLVLATKSSSFVLPKDIVKKLILGLSSTASVQISCQAQILWTIPVQSLLDAAPSWTAEGLTLELDPPEASRPIIETSTIHRAILDRGFLINETAELDGLLSRLSDLVAASSGAQADEGVLQACRASLEGICAHALERKNGSTAVSVRWRNR